MIPQDHTSMLLLYSCFIDISGAMYKAVPQCTSRRDIGHASLYFVVSPKSMIFISDRSSSFLKSMFSGFKSL